MSLGNGLESKLAVPTGAQKPSTPLIYSKMSDVMKEIGAVSKDQKNQAQGFKFRGIDQFVNALYPALTKHAVFMTPRCVRFEQSLTEVTRASGKNGVDKSVLLEMSYTFYATDGSSVTIGPIPAEGLDSGDKATNKALSSALKYALIQTFCIPTEDMAEADLESPERGLAKSIPALKADTIDPFVAAGIKSRETPEQAPSIVKLVPKDDSADLQVTDTRLEPLRKLVIAKAQVAVAKKAVTKVDLIQILSKPGTNETSVTGAVHALDELGLQNALKYLKGAING